MDYGNPSGPPEVARLQQVSHPSLTTLRVNLLRFAVAFVDPAGPALLNPQTGVSACVLTTEVRAAIVAATRMPAVEPAIEWLGSPYSSAPACIFHEDVSWFGITGWLATFIALIWTVIGLVARRPRLEWLLATGCISFLACASLLLRWQPWQGRLLIIAMVLSSPLLGLVIQRGAALRFGRPFLQLLVLYASATGVSATIDNLAKPIGAWRFSSSNAKS